MTNKFIQDFISIPEKFNDIHYYNFSGRSRTLEEKYNESLKIKQYHVDIFNEYNFFINKSYKSLTEDQIKQIPYSLYNSYKINNFKSTNFTVKSIYEFNKKIYETVKNNYNQFILYNLYTLSEQDFIYKDVFINITRTI